jgi:hypothetical protein
LDSFLAERRRIPSDASLARLFDSGHPPVQSIDQLVELTGDLVRGYRHRSTPEHLTSRRETVHISPHFSQRE